MAMDPTTETISTIMQEVVAAQGVRNAVNLVLNGLLHVTERQELYAAVAGWADDNAMLALPPLDTCSQANSGDRADSPLSQYSADDRNVTGDPKTPLVLPGSVPTKDPPGVVGASGRKKSVAASPNRTPWLTHSGLPCNAPTTANDEIIAFSAYVQALPSEVDGRTAVRLSLQKFIQGSVSTESMLKHIGGSAYCVAAFDSALDLVIENSDPSVPSDTVLEVIVRSLQKFEVESTLSYVYGFPAVRMKSGALWKSSWIQQAAGNARLKEKDEPEYVVHIFKDTVETGGLPQPRVVAPRLTTRFTRAPALKRAAFAIKSIFRTAQMGDRPGVVNGYLLLLLLISVIDDRSPAEVPEDASDVLRLFFSFYATFDFKAHTIAPSLSPPRPQADPSPIFLPRRDMDAGAQLSMLDPLGSGMNVGANVTMLPQLTGMIHYFNLLIVKHDSDPRKTLLLSNLVTCSESLWKRQEFLQRSLEVTQPLAVSIARNPQDTFRSVLKVVQGVPMAVMVLDGWGVPKVESGVEMGSKKGGVLVAANTEDAEYAWGAALDLIGVCPGAKVAVVCTVPWAESARHLVVLSDGNHQDVWAKYYNVTPPTVSCKTVAPGQPTTQVCLFQVRAAYVHATTWETAMKAGQSVRIMAKKAAEAEGLRMDWSSVFTKVHRRQGVCEVSVRVPVEDVPKLLRSSGKAGTFWKAMSFVNGTDTLPAVWVSDCALEEARQIASRTPNTFGVIGGAKTGVFGIRTTPEHVAATESAVGKKLSKRQRRGDKYIVTTACPAEHPSDLLAACAAAEWNVEPVGSFKRRGDTVCVVIADQGPPAPVLYRLDRASISIRKYDRSIDARQKKGFTTQCQRVKINLPREFLASLHERPEPVPGQKRSRASDETTTQDKVARVDTADNMATDCRHANWQEAYENDKAFLCEVCCK
ncbi:hypothetical protein DIPPA_15848, partial [Diplonema papillatum]